MTIDEAIKLLKHPSPPVGSVDWHAYFTATQLGIEALKAVKANRDRAFGAILHQLPGETED